MIFDKIENLDRYREFAEYGKLIRDFIKQDKSEHLAEGRYKLDGENLFALVQTYETKDKDDAQMESLELKKETRMNGLSLLILEEGADTITLLLSCSSISTDEFEPACRLLKSILI